MKVRTYYWHDRLITRRRLVVNRLRGRDQGHHFVVGNAGDLMVPELIRRRYGAEPVNDRSDGTRLLLVGSIIQHARSGDILAGVGLHGTYMDVPPPTVPLRILGLRGPRSYDVMKAAGHDVSEVAFLLDPGLTIRFTMTERKPRRAPRGAIFIPHYRDRKAGRRQLPRGIRMVDIDATPETIGRAILGAEIVYASSLHGIIFAHALERPCVFVRPIEEALFKYEDYFASVGLPFPTPLAGIADADLRRAPTSPADVRFREEDFVFPDIAVLREAGIAV
ncbi:MAG: polysaccharide pyruvyl transferase family protein [Bauldia sp.]|nr:polysaccharide pyruvyl transferase family protein [Bauldia sp.]